MSKEKQKDKLDDFAPITMVRFAGDGVKAGSANVLVVELPGSHSRRVRSSVSNQIVNSIDWHPAGVRVEFANGEVAIVPFAQVSSIVQTAAK